MVREPSLPLLREDGVAVRDDVELALLALGDLGGVPVFAQLGRETRGPCVVAASGGAVIDLDAHRQVLNLKRGAPER